jgi:hypothetical protein
MTQPSRAVCSSAVSKCWAASSGSPLRNAHWPRAFSTGPIAAPGAYAHCPGNGSSSSYSSSAVSASLDHHATRAAHVDAYQPMKPGMVGYTSSRHVASSARASSARPSHATLAARHGKTNTKGLCPASVSTQRSMAAIGSVTSTSESC